MKFLYFLLVLMINLSSKAQFLNPATPDKIMVNCSLKYRCKRYFLMEKLLWTVFQKGSRQISCMIMEFRRETT